MSGAADRAGHGRLEGRLVGLGVCGSIAAYKAVELLRLLVAEGADVVVMLTPAAASFVGPLTFAALSRHPVETDVLGLLPDQRIGHVVVADAADVIVVAPATARWLGAMANGIAGDTVVAACLATSAPVVFAPAMDGDMWTHPATQANARRLQRDFGYKMVAPESGALASGQSGVGRLAELPRIVDAIVDAVAGRPVRQPDPGARPPLVSPAHALDLEGRHVVVSAGGTAEPIDPVRFIGNRSSGKMGVAVARAALDRGARVTVVAGRMDVPLPDGAQVIRAETTAAMHDAVIDVVVDRPERRAGDGRRGRRLPPAGTRGPQAVPRGFADARARADRGHPGRGRRAGRRARAAAGHRGVRSRDRVPRAGRGQAPPQGRRPARRQRRHRGRLGLRQRHQPGHRSWRPTAARDELPLLDQARGRRPPPGPRRRGVGRTRTPGRTLPGPPGRPEHERPDRDRPPPDRRRHREALRGRHPDRDHHRLRLSRPRLWSTRPASR